MKRLDVEELKRRHRVEEVIGRDTALKRVGNYLKGFCPLHDDRRTPSLVVWPETQTWHCFGACQTGGDVITYIQLKYKVSFREALALLEGLPPSPPPPAPRARSALPARPLPFSLAQTLHKNLTPAAIDYYHRRRLNEESIGKFLLGWSAGREYGGIYVPRGYTIPCFIKGQLRGIKVRIPEPRPAGESKYRQVKGSKVALFNADSLRQGKKALITEGEFDAILASQILGPEWACVSSTGGAGTFKATWRRFFLPVREVVAIYDSDRAGGEGVAKFLQLIKRGRRVAIPKISPGVKDITDYVLAGGDLLALVNAR